MAKNYTGGLNFTWPVLNETNWSSVVDTALEEISAHDHSGSGNGSQLSTSALVDNAVTGAKFRLSNTTYLRGRNAADSLDVNIVRVDTTDIVEFPTVARFSSVQTLTAASGTEAVSLTTNITVSNKNAGALSLANGQSGQFKLVVNINAAPIVCTPATTSGTNTATLVTNGAVLYWFLNGEWRAFAGAGCTLA